MSYWEDSFDLLKNAAAKQKAGGTAALPKLGAVNYGGGVLPQAAVSRAQALPTLPQKAGEGFALPVLPRNKATLPQAYTPGTKLSFPAPQTGSGGAKLPKLGAVSYGGGVLPKAAANYGELARDTAQPVQDRYSAELKSIEDRMNTGTLSYEQMIQLGRRRKDLLESRKEEALAQARAHIEKLRAQKEELAAREAELRRQGRTGEAKAAALDRRETNKQLIEALTGPEVTESALKYLGQEALMGAKGVAANLLDAFSIQAGKAIDERDSSIYGKRADAESAALLEGVDSEKGLFENIGKVIANMAKNRIAGYVNPFEGTGADKPFLDNLAVLYRNISENAELAAKRGDFGFANAKAPARALGYLKKLIANLVVNGKTAAEQGYGSTEEMEQALTEKLFGNTDWYREQRARLDEEKAKHGGAVQLAGAVTEGAAQMLPSIGVSALTGSPELGLAMTGLTSYGQSAGDAYRETGDIQASHRKGIMDAGIEVGTEKLVGGIPFLGDGAADDLLRGLAKKLSPAAQAAVEGFLQSGAGRAAKYLADKGGEGLEEMISEGLSGAVARATTDPEARDATWQEIKEAGLIGVLTAVALGAGADIASLRQGQSAGAQTLPTPGQNAAGAQGLPSVSYRETGAETLPMTESGGTEYTAEHKKTAGAESADRAKYSIVEDNSGVLRVIADRDIFKGVDTEARNQVLKEFVMENLRGNSYTALADGEPLNVAQKNKTLQKLWRPGLKMYPGKYSTRQEIAAHFDEALQASRPDKTGIADDGGRHGALASNGIDYRTVTVEIPRFDQKGKLAGFQSYDVRITVLNGENGKTGYDISRIIPKEKDSHSVLASLNKQTAILDRESFKDKIAQAPGFVNIIPQKNTGDSQGLPTAGRSGAQALPMTEAARAREAGERLGIRVNVAKLPDGIEGMYLGGELTLNQNGSAPMAQTLAHELTHYLEQSGHYRALVDCIEQGYESLYGKSFAQAAAQRQSLYAQKGVELSEVQARAEAAAQFAAERLYTDERAIEALCRRNESLGQRILQHIRDLLVKLRGTQEEKTLARARQLYEKALRDAGKKGTQGSESARFSLEGQPQAVTMEERAESAQNTTESAAQMLRDESAGMTRGADFGEDAVRLQNPKGVTGGYNKDIYRVLDDAAGKNRALREHLYEAIERPLNMAKEEYARSVDERMTQYAAQMKDLGIEAGSRESAAVQWFGEGKRRGPDGETEAYTLEQLQREFPQNWENIVAAERIHRRIYDEYVERINDALYKVYPDAEERAMQTVDQAKASAEALREKVTVREKQIDLLKEQLREKKAEAERHRAGTNARTKAEQAAAGKAAELSRRQADLARERARWKKAEEKAAKIRGEYEDGTMLRNKRLTPRKDYFHHYQEMEKGLRGLLNIWTSPSEIATSLAGVSEFTKPKSKWASFMQRRGENADYKADAVGGMAKYIPAAEYKISIDPYIAYMRGTIKNIADATAETKNANGLIDLLTDWVGDLAGKTNPIDRPIQKMGGRKLVKTLQWMNARAKANAVVGNLGSALVQIGNIPNATAYVKNPADWGRAGIALAKLEFGRIFGSSRGSDAILEQSPFLRERYLGRATDLLERKNLAQKSTEWMLEIGDKEAAKLTWLAAYQQYQRGGADAGKMMRNYESAVDYADDVTRRSIGGRGIGEVPLSQRSKLVQLAAPFQLEVNNTYQMLKERVGKKDAAGLLSYAVSAWLVNGMLEAISGRRPLFDPIEALMEALKAAGDDDDETNPAQALAGEAVSMIPYAGVVLPALMGDTESEKIFGEDDPTRYGTGNIGLKAASKLAANMAAGEWEKVLAQDLPEAAATYLTPYGGKQLLRAGEGLQDAGILPQLVTNENGEKEIARAKGSYSSGGLYRFPVDGTAETARNMLLGAFGTESGKEYLKNNEKPYSASATAKIRAAEKAGISPQDFTRAYKWMRNGKKNAYKMGIPYDRAAFLNFAIQKLGVSGDQEQLVRQLLDGVSARSITEDDKRQKASEAGIPEKIFKEAYQRTDELEPVYDLNGKEIKGSREYRIAAMIAKYDLTRAQKTALYEILK